LPARVEQHKGYGRGVGRDDQHEDHVAQPDDRPGWGEGGDQSADGGHQPAHNNDAAGADPVGENPGRDRKQAARNGNQREDGADLSGRRAEIGQVKLTQVHPQAIA
jgi:hypothetical protein